MGGIQLCLAGASVGNGNRGVEALGRSVLDVIDSVVPDAQVYAFDDGWGVRADTSGRYRAEVEYVGVRMSRRWHRPESWAQIRLAQRLGGFGNPVARRIAMADALLDVSGGDSFTDLYGETRLRSVSAPKEAALRAGRPLVLLPQTYGPFATAAGRHLAERLVRAASLAYARDPASFERLCELAGAAADPGRLRDGVDVAFALRPRRPAASVADQIEALAGEPLVGVNVSGLLRGPAAASRFRLAGDYVATMSELVQQLVATGVRVLLVPHVHVPGGQGESDVVAIEAVLSPVPSSVRERTLTVPSELDAAEMKWCIAQCQWFVGSRMHATIAALSSQVPACGYAYSDKTVGVFETCGVGAHVIDARSASGSAAVEAMLESFAAREAAGATLAACVPEVVERAHAQLGEVVQHVQQGHADPSLGAIA